MLITKLLKKMIYTIIIITVLNLFFANIAIAEDEPSKVLFLEAYEVYRSGNIYNYDSTQRKIAIDEVKAAFQKVIDNYPNSRFADDAQYYIAYVESQNNNVESTRTEYNKLINNYSDKFLEQETIDQLKFYYDVNTPIPAIGHYGLGWAFQRMLQYENPIGISFSDAVKEYNYVVNNYPTTDIAVISKFKVGDIYSIERNYPEAVKYYRDFIDTFKYNNINYIGKAYNNLAYFYYYLQNQTEINKLANELSLRYSPTDYLTESGFFGINAIWNKRNITFGIEETATLEQRESIIRALNQWSNLIDNPFIFQYKENSQEKLIPNDDGADIFFRFQSFSNDELHSGSTNRSAVGDFLWRTVVSLPNDIDKQPYLYEISLHEIGHALGLGHSYNQSDIMYIAPTGLQDLSKRDINTIKLLYPMDNAPPSIENNYKSGLFNYDIAITLKTSEYAKIYYTIDGSEPNINSSIYNGGIYVNKSTTLKYFAVDAVGNRSSIYTENYTIDKVIGLKLLTPDKTFMGTDKNIINISGIAELNSTVTINGEPVNIDKDGNFSKEVYLNVGYNEFTITGKDLAGNIGNIELTINYYDYTPPSLKVISPLIGMFTTEEIITVTGVTEVDSVVEINNQETKIDANGNFSFNLKLNEGVNQILVTATDPAGNKTSNNRWVGLDTQAPGIDIITSDNMYTKDSNILISGYCWGDILTINGEIVNIDSMGYFNHELSIIEGENVIDLVATDKAGNVTIKNLRIFRDNTSPNLEVTLPKKEQISTNKGDIILEGIVDPESSIKINEEPVINNNGIFSHTVSIIKVNNAITTITISTRDKAGNETTITKKVRYDNEAPLLSINSPISNFNTRKSEVNLIGKTEMGSIVKINGITVSLDSNGMFNKTLTLESGNNKITIISTDAAGNENKLERIINYDNVVPNLKIVSPKKNLLTNKNTVRVEGTAEIGSTVKVNGVTVALNSQGKYSKTVSLVVGNNTITITAVDKAGNLSKVVREVILDKKAPKLIVVFPTNNLKIKKSTILVRGSTESGSTVKINGVNLTINSKGNFSKFITLKKGYNNITITSTDQAGNVSILKRKVIRI